MRPLPPAASQFWCTVQCAQCNQSSQAASQFFALYNVHSATMCIRVASQAASKHLCTLQCTLECCSVLTIAINIIVIFGIIIVIISVMFCCCYHHNHSGQLWSKLESCSALTVPIIIVIIIFIIIIVIRVIAITVIVVLMSSEQLMAHLSSMSTLSSMSSLSSATSLVQLSPERRQLSLICITTRAHNLCHDNRQLIVIAINRNHSASKNNCN